MVRMSLLPLILSYLLPQCQTQVDVAAIEATLRNLGLELCISSTLLHRREKGALARRHQ